MQNLLAGSFEQSFCFPFKPQMLKEGIGSIKNLKFVLFIRFSIDNVRIMYTAVNTKMECLKYEVRR